VAVFFSKDPAINKETKSLRSAILAISEKSMPILEQHNAIIATISNDIVKELDLFIKNKDPERKKIIAEGQKLVKGAIDAKNAASKAKDFYEKAMKESELAMDAFLKAESEEVSQPDLKRLKEVTKRASQKQKQLEEKAKTLETAYQSAINFANSELENFYSNKIPEIIEKLQTIEEDHWNLLLSSVQIYSNCHSALPDVFTNQITELNSIIEVANLDSDFKEFVSSNQKDRDSQSTLEPIEFISYKGKYTKEETTDKTDEKKKSSPTEKPTQESQEKSKKIK